MEDIKIGKATALTSPDPLVLVCTEKEDGTTNLAPVSFFMYASFNPPMLAFGMGKASHTGERVRTTGKAVLAVPGTSLAEACMGAGSTTGADVDKVAEFGIEMREVAGSRIQAPADSRVVFECTLDQTVEAGDHYLYVMGIDRASADESVEALFAWDGYAKVAPAKEA